MGHMLRAAVMAALLALLAAVHAAALVAGASDAALGPSALLQMGVAAQHRRTGAPAASLAGLWSHANATGTPPPARKGHSASLIGQRVFVFGGSAEPAHKCFNDLHVLDLATMAWERADTLQQTPPPLTGHSASVVMLTPPGEAAEVAFLYVLGGFSFSERADEQDASVWHNDLWVLDTRSLAWTTTAYKGEGIMTPRQAHTATLVDGFLYVFGGYSDAGPAANDLLAMKVRADEADGKYEWHVVPVVGRRPSARQGHVTLLLAHRYLVVIGGYAGTGGQSLQDVYVLDRAKLVTEDAGARGYPWSAPHVAAAEHAPPPMQDMSGTVLTGEDRALLFGGCAYPSNQCYANVHVLSLTHGADGAAWAWLSAATTRGAGVVVQPREEHSATLLPLPGRPANETNLLVLGGCQLNRECYADALLLRLSSAAASCPADCSGHGECQLGACACESAYAGADCARTCPADCSGHGTCAAAECQCDAGFTGPDCAARSCPDGCSGHGACLNGTCACEPAFVGASCNQTCAVACPPNAHCVRANCECKPGFHGADCQPEASNCTGCSGHGACNGAGACTCDAGYTGADCGMKAAPACPSGCTGHGACQPDGTCHCAANFTGAACDVPLKHVTPHCPRHCSGHGVCNTTTFTCACMREATTRYYGPDCSAAAPTTVRVPAPITLTSPDGTLLVPAHNTNVTVAVVHLPLPDGGSRTDMAAVPAAPDLPLFAVVPVRRPGYAEDELVQVRVRLAAGQLWAQLPHAPIVTVHEPLASGRAALPNVAGFVEGDVLLLSEGTAEEEVAVVVGAAGADQARFRSALGGTPDARLASSLRFDHAPPVAVQRLVPAPAPLPLPDNPDPHPRSEPLQCGCRGGQCVRGAFGLECQCYPGWSGVRCDRQACPHNCTSPAHGACRVDAQTGDQQCVCRPSYAGPDCSQHTGCGDLGRSCGPNAACHVETVEVESNGVSRPHDFGFCRCLPGWAGPLCDVAECPRNCTSAAHGECRAQGRGRRCACRMGWQGAACDVPDPCPHACSGHGQCLPADPDAVGRHCECQVGWGGPDCGAQAEWPQPRCPEGCNAPHGRCEEGRCVCRAGWLGDACSEPAPCPRNCSGQGRCVAGTCVCDHGFTGEDCGVLSQCPRDCSHRGRCVLGACVCALGFGGPDCSAVLPCPNNCSAAGMCVQGKCECDPGRSGDDCSIEHGLRCATNCSNRGDCHFGRCYCHPGWQGAACEEELRCPRGLPPHAAGQGASEAAWLECSGRGVCKYGRCFCVPGHEGDDCHPASDRRCPRGGLNQTECSDQGVCVEGRCYCHAGRHGDACERGQECAQECQHGFCFNGNCLCDLGFTGPRCNQAVTCPGASGAAPSGCHGNGECLRGRCYCHPGFSGADCGVALDCPNNCSSHGRCTAGVCLCDPGYEGDDCARLAPCPQDCNRRGVCVLGTCACSAGFVGRACELRMPCPADCSGHGDCLAGECQCDAGYYGSDCSRGAGSSAPCPNNCSRHGVCVRGQCSCSPGWEGRSCREPLRCLANCSGHGLCTHGDCFCSPGWQGSSCHIQVECKRGCSGHGVCSLGRCFCQAGYIGDDCSVAAAAAAAAAAVATPDGLAPAAACPLGLHGWQCSGHGACRMGQCDCGVGWYGADCSQQTVVGECPNQCSHHGLCGREGELKGKCMCYPGWTGADCSKLTLATLQASAARCPAACGGPASHGACEAGACRCDPGWAGDSCSMPLCPNACTLGAGGVPNGVCTDGRCVCSAGYGGDDCSVECPGRCSGHGTCENSPVTHSRDSYRCYCLPGYTGHDCSEVAVKRTGLALSSLIGIALATFVVGLVVIPLTKSYLEKKDLRKRMQIIYGSEPTDDLPRSRGGEPGSVA